MFQEKIDAVTGVTKEQTTKMAKNLGFTGNNINIVCFSANFLKNLINNFY